MKVVEFFNHSLRHDDARRCTTMHDDDVCLQWRYAMKTTRDVKFVFSKFEFWPLKPKLNLNFVYIFVEKLKQFAFDVCTAERDEGYSTHTTRREAVYQQCNQPRHQAMSHSICCVFWPLRFVTLIACISMQHVPGHSARPRVIEHRSGMQGGERRGGVSKCAMGVTWIDGRQRTKKSSHSEPLK